MVLCRVTGAVVATRKHARLRGHRLLLVQRLAPDGSPDGGRPEETALDPGLSAGRGDVVLVAKEGAVVAQLLDAGNSSSPTPANVVIVAVVDAWEAGGLR